MSVFCVGAQRARWAIVACAAAVLPACTRGGEEPREAATPSDDFASRHTSFRRARIVVGDAERTRLTIIDAEDDEVVAELPLEEPADVEATESGTFAVVRPRSASAAGSATATPTAPSSTSAESGRARLLYGGVAIVDHVDHIHIYKYPARLLDQVLPPARLHVREGLAAALGTSDPSGQQAAMWIAREDEMVRGAPLSPVALAERPPHGGFAVPLSSSAVLVTRAAAAGVAPDSLEVRTETGALQAGPFACEGASAHVALGGAHVVSCNDEVLLLRTEGGTFDVRRVPATGTPAGALVAAPAARYAIARVGTRAIAFDSVAAVRVEAPPEATGGAEVCDVGADAAHPDRAVMLLSDGSIRSWTPNAASHDGDVQVSVISPFGCSDPVRPRLATAPERAYVTDPSLGRVIDVDLRRGKVSKAFEVGGRPSSIAIVGVDAKNANVAPGAAHDGF
jgi:hypothetical protein